MINKSESRLKLIVHPIRSRIFVALMGRELTTAQIGESLADVPIASLYRHIQTLYDTGLLEVVEEIQARGKPERVYRIATGASRLKDGDYQTADDHVDAFTGFLGSLSGCFRQFVRHPRFDPKRHRAHTISSAFNLTPIEYRQMIDEVYEVLHRYQANEPAEGRARTIFATIAIPEEPHDA